MSGYWATYHPYAILAVGAVMVAPPVWALVDLILDHRRRRRASASHVTESEAHRG